MTIKLAPQLFQFMNELKAGFYPRYGDTHIVLYDLFDPGHCENEDKRDERGVATGR